MHTFKLDLRRRRRRNRIKVGLRYQSLLKKFLWTDEQGITGEGGIAGVGRITIAGRPKRQHLPQTLAAGDQKIGKGVRFLTQIADTKSSGKRSWMKQNAAGSGKTHMTKSSLSTHSTIRLRL